MKRLDTNAALGLAEAGEPSAIRVALCGATGRLGRRIAALAEGDARLSIVAFHGRANPPVFREESRVSAVIDVSSDEGAAASAGLAEAAGAALLVGTTGLSDGTVARLDRLSKKVPVMLAPNLSRGVAILAQLLRTLAAAGPEWDFDLTERHHRGKRDAPSGTALMLARSLRELGGPDRLAGRIHSIRAGGIVGEHEVRLTAPQEELVVAHRALDRDVFARGAIEAVCWLARQPAGLHPFAASLAG